MARVARRLSCDAARQKISFAARRCSAKNLAPLLGYSPSFGRHAGRLHHWGRYERRGRSVVCQRNIILLSASRHAYIALDR